VPFSSSFVTEDQVEPCGTSVNWAMLHHLTISFVTANRPPRRRKDSHPRRSRESYRGEGSSRGASRLFLSYSAFSKKRPIKSLHNKRVLSIDLSAIMAGSGIRGQFEEKFKALLRDIEDEVRSSTSTSSCQILTHFIGSTSHLLHRRSP